MRRYVIVGTGVAGISAAEAIRASDPSGQIDLIGNEPDGYYSRPGLAYFLTGEVSEDLLFPFSEQDFESLGVRRHLTRATHIDAEQHVAHLADGERIRYDRLLIAVGAAANWPKLPGVDLQGVVKLDNLADARQILKLARRAREAVVVGGGITALELVEGLRARKVKVHYFLRRDRYWGNVLDEVESRIVESRLEEEGVHIHFHTELEEILGKRGQVVGALTQEPRRIPCQLVAIAIGIRPRLDLARNAGLRVDRGVLVDEFLATSLPDIYAAGDVAQVFDPFSGRSIVDSLWGPARQQGRTAGLNMTGQRVPYQKGVPFNVTRLAGLTTTIIGTVGGGDDEDVLGIARGDSETWRQLPDAIAVQDDFDVNRLRVMVGEHTLRGAIVMGDQTLSRPLHQLVAEQVDIREIRGRLLAEEAPLADILTEFWFAWSRRFGAQKP